MFREVLEKTQYFLMLYWFKHAIHLVELYKAVLYNFCYASKNIWWTDDF